MNWLTSKLISRWVKFVQADVSQYGGHLTWNFSQAINPVASMIGADPQTASGICEMLSAKWIDEHANGRSLSTWLMDGDAINPSKISLLMQFFIIGTTLSPSKMIDIGHIVGSSPNGLQRGNGDVNQTMATQNFLLSRGIIRRHGGNYNGWGEGTGLGGEKIKRQIARKLCDLRNGSGSYRAIGIWGLAGGHCMAAYTGEKDIVFFDPSFGEFWFEDKAKFAAWFINSFFIRSTYSKILCDNYKIDDYASKLSRQKNR